jgi:hypothetical protein
VNNEFGEDLVNELDHHSQQEIATRKRSRTISYLLRGNVLCVPVNTEFGDVISFEAYLIRIKRHFFETVS